MTHVSLRRFEDRGLSLLEVEVLRAVTGAAGLVLVHAVRDDLAICGVGLLALGVRLVLWQIAIEGVGPVVRRDISAFDKVKLSPRSQVALKPCFMARLGRGEMGRGDLPLVT
jgi:hypothetical protein